MLIDIKESKYSFSQNVFNKMAAKKYGIRTPYCNTEILEGRLISDLLYMFDDVDVDAGVTNIDINNIFTGLSITYVTNNYINGHYRHVQTTPAAVWDIIHNLGKDPIVAVYDTSGQQIEVGIEINVPNVSIKVYFNNPTAGVAEVSI